jgi:hypothetical protein
MRISNMSVARTATSLAASPDSRRPVTCRAGRIAIVLIPLLAGCTAFTGYPDRVTAPANDLAALQKSIDADRIVACLAVTAEPAARDCRNQLVSARVYAVDLQFTQFEQRLFEQTREAGFAATLATLGLTTAGALVSGIASQALAGAAGALTGGRAAFEREVLAERTIVAIHTSMRANRMSVLARIRRGLQQTVSDYPVGAGLTDVEEYYFAGTVLGALVGITEAVGVQATDAAHRLDIASGLSQSAAARALRLYFDEPGLTEQERLRRLAAIQQAAREEGLGDITVASFVRDARPQTEEQQARVARRLRLIQ